MVKITSDSIEIQMTKFSWYRIGKEDFIKNRKAWRTDLRKQDWFTSEHEKVLGLCLIKLKQQKN